MGDGMRLIWLSIMWGLSFGWLYLIILSRAAECKGKLIVKTFDNRHPNLAQVTDFVLFMLMLFLGTAVYIFIPFKVLTHFGEKIHFQIYLFCAVTGIVLKIGHLKITKIKL